MSAVGLESIDHTVQLTHIWINDLDERLDWNNKARSYRLLKAVFHAVRDWLQINEAVDLAAQLPTLLRGAYYEKWRPAATPAKPRGKDHFLSRVEDAFESDPVNDMEAAVAAVFDLLTARISRGEVDDVRQALPEDIRKLWRRPPE